VEFAYNNSYQASIQMENEALYGRKCRSPVCWDAVGEKAVLGPDLVQQAMGRVGEIRQHMLAAPSMQKSCADSKRSNVEFQVGEEVLLRVSTTKGVIDLTSKKS
jgi:hypothetical protein